MQISGKVQAIIGRNTSVGQMFDLTLEGDNKKYGLGKFAPRDVQPGDFVSFGVDVKQNGQYTNYNVAKGTLRKDGGAQPAPAAAPSAPAKTGYSGNAGGFDSRQETISKQAALNTSLAFCNLANTAGAIPHLAKAKEADKLGLVQATVLEYAAMFYNLSTGQTWAMPELDIANVDKPAAKPKAKAPAAAVEQEDTGYEEY